MAPKNSLAWFLASVLTFI